MANKNGWTFKREVEWDTSNLKNFDFFISRPIELKRNSITGSDLDNKVKWEIADIVFDEGAMLALEVYLTTALIVRLPSNIPSFIIDKEGFFDKIFHKMQDISNTRDQSHISVGHTDKFNLTGKDKDAITKFFTPELIHFLEKNDIHHIESNGKALLIFKYLHIARTEEIQKMHDFALNLLSHMNLDSKS